MPTENIKQKTPILNIFAIVFVWRVILWLFAWVVKNRLHLLPDPGYGQIDRWSAPVHPLLAMWARWDSGFYLQIADSGYFFDQAKNLYNVIFFPLYPLLIKGLSFILANNLVLSGVILSFVFTFLSCLFIYKIADLDFSNEDKNIAKRAVIYLLIFPAAVFLGAVYNESLFIFLTAASFYFARKNKWLASGPFGFLAALTRPQGILLLPILLLEYFEQREFKITKVRFNIFNLLWIPAGLGIYMNYLQNKFGNAFLFLSQQNLWGRTTNMTASNFTKTIADYFHDFLNPGSPFAQFLNKDMEFIFFLVFLVLGVIIFFRLRMSYGLYVLLGLAFPVATGTLTSLPRYCLLLFPVFIYLAKLGKNQTINFAISTLFAIFLGLFTLLFVNWYWAA